MAHVKFLRWFKALLIVIVFISLNTNETLAQNQVPQGINYQAIARNSNGGVFVNQNIGLRISILEGNTPGIIRYQERQIATTNIFGLFTLKIGAGTPILGVFNEVDWSAANHYLKIEIDNTGGTNYTDLGLNELLSVPYAFYAQKSGNGGSGASGLNCWDLNGNGQEDANEDIARGGQAALAQDQWLHCGRLLQL